MKTTLTPPPNEKELGMIAEWVGAMMTLPMQYTLHTALEMAESLLTEFRSRYGIVGEVEASPEGVTIEEVVRMIPKGQSFRVHWNGSGVVFNGTMAGGGFFSIPELIQILKGGNNG